MRILIDGDGCPVIGLTLDLAGFVPVWVFTDVNHCPGDPRAKWVSVDEGRDSADLALVNRTQPGDIVVTQDYALAALALARGAVCLHQDGWRFDEAHIDGLLASRHEAPVSYTHLNQEKQGDLLLFFDTGGIRWTWIRCWTSCWIT